MSRRRSALQGILDETLREGAPDVYVSHFLHGPVTGQPVIFVARPLRSPWERKLGIVYVSIDLEAFSQLADQITGQDHRAMVVIEPDTGIVLARSATSGVQLGSVFPDVGLVSAMRAHPNGGHIVGSLQRRARDFRLRAAAGRRDVRRHGCRRRTASRRPRHRQPADASSASPSRWLPSRSPSAAPGSLGYYSQVRPAKQLADVAERIGEGDLNARAALETWQAPEFRRLGDTLDEMAERLQLTNQAFKASEARYKLLAENTADLVTHIDSGGRRTYASPASQALLGYAPRELIGGDPIDLAHPHDRPQLAHDAGNAAARRRDTGAAIPRPAQGRDVRVGRDHRPRARRRPRRDAFDPRYFAPQIGRRSVSRKPTATSACWRRPTVSPASPIAARSTRRWRASWRAAHATDCRSRCCLSTWIISRATTIATATRRAMNASSG